MSVVKAGSYGKLKVCTREAKSIVEENSTVRGCSTAATLPPRSHFKVHQKGDG